MLSMTDNSSNYSIFRTKLSRLSAETERVLLSCLTLILWVVIAIIIFPPAVVFAQTTPSPTESVSVQLTADEQTWLAQNHTIQIRVTDYPPFMIVKKGMEPTGIAIDYFNLIARRTGIKFNYNLSERPFADALKGMQNREGPDLMTIIARTAEREKTLSFTDNYLSIPRVIFTRHDEQYIAGLEALVNKTIAVPRGVQIHDQFQARYPDVKLLLFDTDLESLQAVATGKADAYVGNLTLSSYLIQQRTLSALKVAAPSPFGDQIFSMGHRNDWPELTSILNKGLDSITPEEKAQIQSEYVAIQFEHSTNIDDILKWIIIVGGTTAGIIFFFMFWTRSLARKVASRTLELENTNITLEVEANERKKAELDLRASRDFLKNLTDSMGDVVVSIKMPEREMEWISDRFGILGYSPEECIGQGTDFFYATESDFLAIGEQVAKAVTENQDVIFAESNLKRKNGEIFTAEATISLYRVNNEVVSLIGILRDVSDRKLAEEQVLIYQKRLKALASQLTLVEETERRRIATDLHDDVCQSLALVRIQVSSARKKATSPSLTAKLDDIAESLLQTLQSTRRLMSDLSSPSMNEIGLPAAISELLGEFVEKQHNLKTEFIDNTDDLTLNELDNNVRAILFRNVREILTNVIKHARAKKVSVCIQKIENLVMLTIQDDGIGFNPDATSKSNGQNGGFGLFSIKERMFDLNGNFEMVSAPGDGCKVLLTVPIVTDDIKS
jgi:PAS domain S-box-containing protein